MTTPEKRLLVNTRATNGLRKAAAVKNQLKVAMLMAGIDFHRFRATVAGLPSFARQYRDFRSQSLEQGLPIPRLELLYPIIGDDKSVSYDAHYLHQDLWAARRLYERRPIEHIDIGSRVDGFISSALVFCPVTMVDIRPLGNAPLGLRFQRSDATCLPYSDGSVMSISSLHAMEHFGLGRYGDPINAAGSLLGLAELARVLAPGGRAYVGLPVGRERVMFNAHRVLSPRTVLSALRPLDLVSFAAIDDDGFFIAAAETDNFEDAAYACGLFELTKA